MNNIYKDFIEYFYLRTGFVVELEISVLEEEDLNKQQSQLHGQDI